MSKEWRKERVHITETAVTDSDIQMFASTFNGVVPTHKRIGVPGTLHRISLITHPARDELVRAAQDPHLVCGWAAVVVRYQDMLPAHAARLSW